MVFENAKLKEFNNYIKNKKVAIIGVGVSNLPLIDYFYKKKANITIFDNKEKDQMSKEILEKISKYMLKTSLGENYLSELKGFDLILRSPSCLPTVKELELEEKNGAIVTTEIELFMKMCPCKIIGITGSDGKTTTTTLITEILKNAGINTYVGGNIGIPLFTKLNEVKPEDIAVLELSSFQLMGMEISPDISIITNITPNHLNVHKDYQEYIDAKKNIYKHQNKDGILILNYNNEITKKCSIDSKGKVIFFSSKTKLENGYILDENTIKKCTDGLRKHLIHTEEITIKGRHNYENICAAIAATEGLVDMESIIKTCKEFKGVEHRIEFVKEINGVKWYNDSASSSPSRMISALNAFDKGIVLIAGGYDKNLDYHPVAEPIIDKVETLILIGQTSEKIFDVVKEETEKQGKEINIYMCKDLNQAVIFAKRYSNDCHTVLFSPGSASFDMFKNMYERGNIFKDIVNKM